MSAILTIYHGNRCFTLMICRLWFWRLLSGSHMVNLRENVNRNLSLYPRSVPRAWDGKALVREERTGGRKCTDRVGWVCGFWKGRNVTFHLYKSVGEEKTLNWFWKSEREWKTPLPMGQQWWSWKLFYILLFSLKHDLQEVAKVKAFKFLVGETALGASHLSVLLSGQTRALNYRVTGFRE